MTPFIPLLAATVALIGTVGLIALGVIILVKRTETSSLFVEDRMGFVVVKIVLATVVIAVGCYWTREVIMRLITMSP